MFRECCWHLSMRGSVGETGLHVCFLVPSSLHMELAKRMVAKFPKLINDIYISEEYYGENVLHMATVNEDPAMVKYLLDAGVNFQVKIWEKENICDENVLIGQKTRVCTFNIFKYHIIIC